jgi:large subunit ribosomal protein MRP49
MMPRIKFRNPAVPVQVSRHTDEKGPALLHVYTKAAAPTAADAAPAAAPSADAPAVQPTYTIQMRSSQPSEILDRLVEKTGAVVVKATPAEEQEMADLKEQRERSEADRVLVREKLIKERREAELLKLARGEVPSVA